MILVSDRENLFFPNGYNVEKYGFGVKPRQYTLELITNGMGKDSNKVVYLRHVYVKMFLNTSLALLYIYVYYSTGKN